MGAGIFDAVAGADESALNAILAAFYQAIPSLFTQQFQVNQDDVTSIQVEIQAPPTVSLLAPSVFHDEAREFAAPHVSPQMLEQAVRMLAAGTLTLNLSRMAATVNGGPSPINVNATAAIAAVLGVEQNGQGQNVIVISLMSAVFDVPGDPFTTTILNSYLGPKLVAYLNTSVFGPFQIPALTLAGINFVAPTITDDTSPAGDNFIMVYTGLQPVTLPDPGSADWPTGTLFIAVDANALNTVAAAALPNKSDSGCFDPPNLDWKYGISFAPNIQIQPGNGNEVTVSMSVTGGAGFLLHTPNWLPNFGFSGSITGSCTASADLIATPSGNNQAIGICIQSAGNFNLQLNIDDIPSWVMDIFSPLIDPLLDIIGAAAAAILQNFTFTVYTLDAISLSFANLPAYQLVLNNLALNQIAGPGGLPLAAVTAQPGFVQSAAVEVAKGFTVGRSAPLGLAAE